MLPLAFVHNQHAASPARRPDLQLPSLPQEEVKSLSTVHTK